MNPNNPSDKQGNLKNKPVANDDKKFIHNKTNNEKKSNVKKNDEKHDEKKNEKEGETKVEKKGEKKEAVSDVKVKKVGLKRKKKEAGDDGDDNGEDGNDEKKSGKKVSVKRKKVDDEDDNGLYRLTVESVHKNQGAIMDSRGNFVFGIPKKGHFVGSLEEWRSVQDRGGKLTNQFVQIASNSINIKGPLILVHIQNIRADADTFRYLKPEEYLTKEKSLHRNMLLGSSISIEQHPELGVVFNPAAEIFPDDDNNTNNNEEIKKKKVPQPSLQGEWIFWLKEEGDKYNVHYPMTIATFAQLYRSGIISQIKIHSEKGWTLFTDEERTFLIPNNFIPTTKASIASTTADDEKTLNNTKDESQDIKENNITPAISLSKAAKEIIEQANQSQQEKITTP